MRAQELGQPLTCRLIGWSRSRSARRSSSSRDAAAAVALVSTIASLQYSMPVQAIVPRRKRLGRGAQAELGEAGDERLDVVLGSTSSTTSFWCGVVRTRREPCASARSARCVSIAPETRPTMGAAPM